MFCITRSAERDMLHQLQSAASLLDPTNSYTLGLFKILSHQLFSCKPSQFTLCVSLSTQPLPESMVARLCESKKVCGAADTQLQVQ